MSTLLPLPEQTKNELTENLLCSTPNEVKEWLVFYWPYSRLETTTRGAMKHFCSDCTPEYQKLMKLQNKCVWERMSYGARSKSTHSGN